MALCVAAIVLALLSTSTASTPDCKDLVEPLILDDFNMVFGKWLYVLGSGDPKPYHKALASMRSSWIEVSPTPDSQTITLRWGDSCFGRCIYGEANATVSGVATTFRKGLAHHKGHLLRTCSECLLWTDTFRNGDVTGRYIMQFTRTGKIDPEDVATFNKKAECLNFAEGYHSYDGETEFCPDNKSQE